jgi:hypothetical protein
MRTVKLPIACVASRTRGADQRNLRAKTPAISSRIAGEMQIWIRPARPRASTSVGRAGVAQRGNVDIGVGDNPRHATGRGAAPPRRTSVREGRASGLVWWPPRIPRLSPSIAQRLPRVKRVWRVKARRVVIIALCCTPACTVDGEGDGIDPGGSAGFPSACGSGGPAPRQRDHVRFVLGPVVQGGGIEIGTAWPDQRVDLAVK